MHSRSESRSRRYRMILYAMATVAAFAVGSWIARATVIERPLLDDAENASIYGEKKASLSDQVDQALYVDGSEPYNQRDAEQAWRGVVEHWSGSGDIYSLGPAYGRLAEIYLDQEEFNKALDAYHELYNLAGDTEQQWKAEALAGQYEIYDLMGKPQERDPIGAELLPLRDQLKGGPFENTVLVKLQGQVEKQRESEPTRKSRPPAEGA